MGISLSAVLNQRKDVGPPPSMLGQAPAGAPSTGLNIVSAGKTVTLSDGAARQARAIIAKEGHDPDKVWLRLGVKGGGCSGLSYVIDVAQKKDAHDVEFESAGIRIIVDKKSMLYVGGMQLDFGQGLKAGWHFNNPNQKKGCSCGESFSV